MTINLYVARRFALLFLLILGVFFGMLLLLGMVEQVGRFASIRIGFGQLVGLAALKVPESLYRILPLIVILSAIALFLALARSSELVVIRASGRSALRLLVAPVTVALLLGVGAITVLNPLVAATKKQHEEMVQSYTNGEGNVLSVSSEGLWLRQGGGGQQMVIRAARANDDGTELTRVTFLEFDRDGHPLSRTEAGRADLEPGAWALTGVKRWNLRDENPEATAVRSAEATIPSDLTPDKIRDSFGQPGAVPIWALPEFIRGLEAAGFSSRQHRVWLQMELALPLLFAGMVLLAAAFTMRHTRFGQTGLMVLFAVLSGFVMYFLRNFAQVLGENGQIPVVLAAWSPPVATILLALGLLLHREEG